MTTIYYNDYPVPIASEPRETYRTAHVQTPAEKYNLNFMFGPVRDLESRYIRLEPLIVSSSSVKRYRCKVLLDRYSLLVTPKRFYAEVKIP
jgi:hypothetical protein